MTMPRWLGRSVHKTAVLWAAAAIFMPIGPIAASAQTTDSSQSQPPLSPAVIPDAPAATTPPADVVPAPAASDQPVAPSQPSAATTTPPSDAPAAPATATAPTETPAPAAATAATPPAQPETPPAAAATSPAPSQDAPAAMTAPADPAAATDTPATPPAAAVPAVPDAPAQAAAPPPPVAHDPVIAAVRQRSADPAFAGTASSEDRTATAAFYQQRADGPLWVKPGAFSPAGEAVIAEIRKADEWGLAASAFTIPSAPSDTPEAQADAESALTLVVLQYARHARGGRLDPLSLSPNFDMKPPVKDPAAVLKEISTASAADAYLRDLHPKHEQFVRLKAELAKLKTPAEVAPPPEDEALAVKLPTGRILRPGQSNDDVSLLRRRLKVPAEAGNENVYDLPLQEAVMAFQRSNGIKANGLVGKQTRAALNGDDDKDVKPNPERDVQRIVNNMERWRWMPEKLGDFYVFNNVPEYLTRAFKDGKQVYEERIVVGLPQWTTPSFSARMRTIVFHPDWGVPDGIKTKELLPQLRRSSGGGGSSFFEELFGGPGSSGSSSGVLRRHDLRVSYGGRPVDPDSVDWNRVDIRRFQFTQPPGPKNVLGIVKFLFPNKHDVYMHDTTAKHLFQQSRRSYSHGCMRVANPVRFAELLLQEDKGWSPAEVNAQFGGGQVDVKLDKEIWVHNGYFTVYVDDSGKLRTFADVYGYEPRVTAALTGKNMQFEAVPQIAEVAPGEEQGEQPRKQRRKQRVTQSDPLTEAIQGLFAN